MMFFDSMDTQRKRSYHNRIVKILVLDFDKFIKLDKSQKKEDNEDFSSFFNNSFWFASLGTEKTEDRFQMEHKECKFLFFLYTRLEVSFFLCATLTETLRTQESLILILLVKFYQGLALLSFRDKGQSYDIFNIDNNLIITPVKDTFSITLQTISSLRFFESGNLIFMILNSLLIRIFYTMSQNFAKVP